MTGPHDRPAAAPLTRIDARHLLCPLPVLRLRKTLAALPPGAEVALIATDPAAAIDVPHFCAEAGHLLLDQTPAPDGARRFLVRRGPDREPAPPDDPGSG